MKVLQLSDVIRGFAWRFGRRLYTRARGERENDPRTNGEYWLLEKVVGVGEERMSAARSLERPKAASTLRQIAGDFAGTGIARKALEAAKTFE